MYKDNPVAKSEELQKLEAKRIAKLIMKRFDKENLGYFKFEEFKDHFKKKKC